MAFNFIFFFILFFIFEIFYLYIARRYSIIDKPNFRSSHFYNTIRGGGIIFPISTLIQFSSSTIEYFTTASCLLAISILSFIDDLKNIDSRIKLIFQSLVIFIMVYSLCKEIQWFLLPLIFVLVIGAINAYNFMDGINGITVLYSIICIGTLFWISENIISLQVNNFFLSILSSLLVFSLFNFRNNAVVFAGDVGSISIAFTICYLIINLAIATHWVWWILFLGVYGVDTVFTIFCRIIRKEPLMEPHRSHFYQYLVNEAKKNHLEVSSFYALLQLIINIIVVYSYCSKNSLFTIITLLAFTLIYIIIRLRLEGHKRLFVTYNPD